MKMRVGLVLVGLFLSSALTLAQSTQPADSAALRLRAEQAFARGEYAAALPMLQTLAEQLKDQPDALGPVNEQIRVCQKNLADAQADAGSRPAAAAAETSAPPTGEQRVPHVKPKDGQTLSLAIKELGNFEYDSYKGGNVPADVLALSGSAVRVRGFMIPMDSADRITQFALVPSLFDCCFGQPPQLQHTVVVNVPPGKAVRYFQQEIEIEGTLKVEEKKEDDFIVSLFELDAAKVQAAPR